MDAGEVDYIREEFMRLFKKLPAEYIGNGINEMPDHVIRNEILLSVENAEEEYKETNYIDNIWWSDICFAITYKPYLFTFSEWKRIVAIADILIKCQEKQSNNEST